MGVIVNKLVSKKQLDIKITKVDRKGVKQADRATLEKSIITTPFIH